jgi:hypothetical protein
MLQAKSTASKRSAVKQTPAAIKADRSGDKIRSDRSGNRKPVPTVPDELDERTARTHYSAIIQELFGNNRKRSSGYQEDNDDDDDDDDMEATVEEMQREERRSTRLGRLEDEQEAARERQRQLNGAKRKKLE